MRTALFIVVALALLALDWAALHDIVKGNETTYWQEYGMLAFSLVIFAGLAFYALRKRLTGKHAA